MCLFRVNRFTLVIYTVLYSLIFYHKSYLFIIKQYVYTVCMYLCITVFILCTINKKGDFSPLFII
nr:MAG TPA: hypothetical protein [Caudoviricetes sp.]